MSKLLKKQKGQCNICKLKFFPIDILERNHIVPLPKGGSNKLDNIQLLYGHYHQSKTAADLKRCETREAG